MTAPALRIALAKQREINQRLQQQLRAETMLTTSLSDLRWLPRHQTPAKLQRLREALALKESLAAGSTPATFYPTGKSKAA